MVAILGYLTVRMHLFSGLRLAKQQNPIACLILAHKVNRGHVKYWVHQRIKPVSIEIANELKRLAISAFTL
jgi:hypothetical protein